MKTDSNNNCQRDMFIRYKGCKLIPSKTASRELLKYGMLIFEVKEILQTGYLSFRKRKTNTIERWLDKGTYTYTVVIVRSFNYAYKEDVYLITHVGRFKRK